MCLNYCEIFIVDIEFTNVAAGCKIQPSGPWVSDPWSTVPCKLEIVSFCVRMCPMLSVFSGNQGFSNSGCISWTKVRIFSNQKTCVSWKHILAVISLHCVRTCRKILLRDAICTHTTHSILYSDFLNACIYIHIYNRTVTCIKTNKKCFYFLITVLQLSFWY